MHKPRQVSNSINARALRTVGNEFRFNDKVMKPSRSYKITQQNNYKIMIASLPIKQ
jgi:hypothetical protein